MLKELVKTGSLYSYLTNPCFGNSGIVFASNKDEAKLKVIKNYIALGYAEQDLSGIRIWKVSEEPHDNHPDVLELFM